MKRTPVEIEISARALTEPRPQFVSLVKAGANQRPFRAVRAEIFVADGGDTQTKGTAMKIADGHDIAQLDFASEDFKDEAAVRAWLDQGGYEDATITATKDGFTVENTDVEFEAGSISKIENAVKGLTAFVGRVAVEEETSKTDDELAATQAETNTSAVETSAGGNAAAKSEGEGDAETVAKGKHKPGKGGGKGGLRARGAKTALAALTGIPDPTEFNAEGEEDEGGDGKVSGSPKSPLFDMLTAKAIEFVDTSKGMFETQELSRVLMSLKFMVDDAEFTGMSDEAIAGIKQAAGTLIEVLAVSMKDTLGKLEDAFKEISEMLAKEAAVSDAEPSGAEETPAVSEGTTKDEGAGDDGGDTAGAKALAAVAKTLTDALADIATKFEKGLGEVKALVTETRGDLETRIDAIETGGQTRKGADVTGSANGNSGNPDQRNKKDERSPAEIRLARAMGSQFIHAEYPHNF